MPMSWNDKTDAKLLTAIIKIHAIKINYEKIAELMGPECTAKAISHRIQKLKQKCKGEFDHIKIEPVSASDVWAAKAPKSSPVNTPSSVATATPTPARGRGRPPKALKRAANSDDEGESKQDLKDRGSPTPKKKKAKVGRPRKNLPDSPNSSFEPAASSGSSPATAAEPVTPASATRRLLPKPLEQPNYYFDDVIGGEALQNDTDNEVAVAMDKPPPHAQHHALPFNVKTEISDEDADVLSDLPALPTLEDFGALGPVDDVANMSFAASSMGMSFDFPGFPDWNNFSTTDDSFLTYNE